jgi:hypothetical protein
MMYIKIDLIKFFCLGMINLSYDIIIVDIT